MRGRKRYMPTKLGKGGTINYSLDHAKLKNQKSLSHLKNARAKMSAEDTSVKAFNCVCGQTEGNSLRKFITMETFKIKLVYAKVNQC